MQGGLYAWIEPNTLVHAVIHLPLMKINKKGRGLRMQGGLYAWIEPNTLVHAVIHFH